MNSEIVFGSRVIRCSAGSNVRLICYWTDWKATYLTRSRNCLLFKREIIPQSFSGLYDISKDLKRNQKHYNYPLQSHWVEWIYAKAWDNETLEKTLTWKTFSKFHSFQDLGRSMNKVPSLFDLLSWVYECMLWVNIGQYYIYIVTIYVTFIPDISHRHHRRCLCKKILPGVIAPLLYNNLTPSV